MRCLDMGLGRIPLVSKGIELGCSAQLDEPQAVVQIRICQYPFVMMTTHAIAPKINAHSVHSNQSLKTQVVIFGFGIIEESLPSPGPAYISNA